MSNQALKDVVQKLADSGWDLIDAPAKAWLSVTDCADTTAKLIAAVEQANKECGSCGCEMDSLYGEALKLLRAA